MAHIHIDKKTMANVSCEDLLAIIRDMIHTELQKPESQIDADFVEECVNAMLEIEQDDDNAFVPLVPLVKRQEFIAQITGRRHNFKTLGRFARVAIVAATLAASTVTANAAVEAVTGVNLLAEAGSKVQDKLESLGVIRHTGIDVVDGEDDDDDIIPPTTEETTTKPTTTEPTTVNTEETTTVTTTTTTKPSNNHHIEVVDGEDDDDDIPPSTTKKPTTTKTTTEPTTEPTTKETTTKAPPPPTTAESVTKPSTKDENEVVFVGVEAYFENGFKTDYIYGEELSYDGLVLMELFSDGTKRELPLEKCNYTRSVDMTKTADYTLRVIYKASIVEIKITVRPDEDTRGAEVCSNEMYDYYLTERGAYVTAYRGDDAEINLDEIDGSKIIAIGEGVFEGKNIEHFTAKNAEKIFPNAFKDCGKLVYADTPSAVYIGSSAFENCTALKVPVFSSELDYVGTSVFKNTGLEEVTLPQNITAIPQGMFENCSQLKAVTLLGDVTDIGDSAFSECTALEKLSGAQHIKNVGRLAFYDDTLLTFDDEPMALASVGDYSFAYCNNLNITHITRELRSLGIGSFMYCYNLSDVVLDGSIKSVPSSAFRGAHIESLTLTKGIRSIGDYAFMSTMIKTLTLPDSVTKIGTYSFYITFLREVYFTDKLTEIPENAFYKNSRLTFYVYKDTAPYYYALNHNIKYELLTKDGSIDVIDGEDD